MNDSIREEKTDEYVKKVINQALNCSTINVEIKKQLYIEKMCDDLEAYFIK